MMFARLSTALILCAMPLFAVAQTTKADDATAVFEAMGLPELMDVLRAEGIDYGAQIGADLFPDRVNADWSAMVDAIYDPEQMRADLLDTLAGQLAGDDVDSMLAFLNSDTGQRIVGLEVSARRAMLDDAVEEASKATAAVAMADETPRYQLVKNYVEVNDLVETNIVGALNSSYAFYMGMQAGGAFPQDMTQEDILLDVRSQEPQIRKNTTEWVYSFLMLAYQPLTDEELRAYIDFSATPAGQELNQALFAAFDGMFEGISRDLGHASSGFMTGQDL
jgi:hypothetical protein